MWPVETSIKSEGFKRLKLDWQPGTLLVRPGRWFHQHFSAGKEPEEKGSDDERRLEGSFQVGKK